MRGRPLIRALTGVVVAALAYTIASPPHVWSPAAWLVPGILLTACHGLRARTAFGCGVLFALLMGWGVTGWAYQAALQYFSFNRALAAAFSGLTWLACGGLAYGSGLALWSAWRPRITPALRGVVAAWIWVAMELLRMHLFPRLPWELLGYTQFRHLGLIQIADIGGVYAVSFVIALVSVTIAELLADRTWRAGRMVPLGRLAPAALLLLATITYGAERRLTYGADPASDGTRVAIVQGNITNAFRWKRAFFERSVVHYARLTREVTRDAPDLIVWPENAINFYLDREPLLRSQIGAVAQRARHGLLVGGPRLGDDGMARNAAYLVASNGEILGSYDKQRLVPFAEYNPMPWIAADPEGPIYVPGREGAPIAAGPMRLGTVICYEIIFPGLIRRLVSGGADVLVNLSNDSWMETASGAAPLQHFSMAIFRAIETRRWIVRSSTTGRSGVIDPSGRVTTEIERGTAGATVASIEPMHVTTPYVRWGEGWILVAGAALGAGIAVGRGRGVA